jgi:hypothetical protein
VRVIAATNVAEAARPPCIAQAQMPYRLKRRGIVHPGEAVGAGETICGLAADGGPRLRDGKRVDDVGPKDVGRRGSATIPVFAAPPPGLLQRPTKPPKGW